MFKVIQRILKDKIATEPVCLSGSERFRGQLAGKCPESLTSACASACPVRAFQSDEASADGYRINYRRCIFCGRCVETAVRGAAGAQGLLHHLPVDAMPFLLETAQEVTAAVIGQRLGRSLHVRHLDAGSCNACDFEMSMLSNPFYDVSRWGINFVASPRHADLLMITGGVTENLLGALTKTYEATPNPKIVMAVGSCGISGGVIGKTYANIGAVYKVVPVDVVVPGCPPRPQALLEGILLGLLKYEEKIKRGGTVESGTTTI